MPGVQDEGGLSRVRWLPDPGAAVTLVSCVAANSLGQQVVELETFAELKVSQSRRRPLLKRLLAL